MKNIAKYILATGLVAMGLSGCIKETFPHGSTVMDEQVQKSPYALSSKVMGIPAFVNKFDILGRVDDGLHSDFGYPAISIMREVMTGDMATVASGYDHFTRWYENTDLGQDYVYGQITWNFMTQWLKTTNDLIAIGKGLTMEGDNKHYMGIAYAYRALIRLDLGRMYEYIPNQSIAKYEYRPELIGLTVPRLDEDITEDIARNNPRLPKAEMIELIKSDLNLALEYLEDFEADETDKTLPNTAVVYGLLARTYLWEGDYAKAKEAAQNALASGNYSPLTDEQWNDYQTGFNSAYTNNSWMLCASTSAESSVVKSGIVNWLSFMSNECQFGYAAAGPFRMCDAALYAKISETDFRKKSWIPNASSFVEPVYNPKTDPSSLPELSSLKFRPGSGEVEQYSVGAVCDFPLMRMEEMEFIIAECDARAGSSASLVNFMKNYRDPEYSTSATGDPLIAEVLLQKRIELWGEGIIYFDFKRCPDILHVMRGYEGTNHSESALFNVPEGVAPWMNFCFVRTEQNNNPALVNNPDPSGTVDLWKK